MYDVCDRQSFENIPMWFGEIAKHASDKCLTVLIGNKSDESGDPRERIEPITRQVSFEEGERLAHEHNSLFFMECSCKTGENVEAIMLRIVLGLLKQVDKVLYLIPPTPPQPPPPHGVRQCDIG